MALTQIKDCLKLCGNVGFINGLALTAKLKAGIVDNLTVNGMPNTFSLRPGSSDIPTFYQIFVGREFEFDLPFEPNSIIDGGANIGLATLFLKSRFPNAKVVCIEPDKDNFRMLEKNVGGLSDVTLIEGGLWHSNTYLTISDKYQLGKWAMIVEENENRVDESSIETFTIDDVMRISNLDSIDLLKLDIETAERELFSENYENWLPKTKAIVIELHDWMSKGCSKPFFKAINNCFEHYSFSTKGENTIIINEDLL